MEQQADKQLVAVELPRRVGSGLRARRGARRHAGPDPDGVGTLPIAFGTGMGADSLRPLGVCVAGGLVFSKVLTLYITPVIFLYLEQLGAWLKRGGARLGPRAEAA
jgi:hypothetical protein